MTRVRSPNYPGISLPDAIERVGKIFSEEQHMAAARDVFIKHMGYSSKSGPALKAISAVEKFGLIEPSGKDKYKVSYLARTILYGSEEEKSEAIIKAAFKPDLFAAIYEEWKGGQPSDANLKSFLINKNFAIEALDKVIRCYKSTMELVNSRRTPNNALELPLEQEKVERNKEMQRNQPIIQKNISNTRNPVSITITGDKIEVSGTIGDKRAAERLIEQISAIKGFLPDKEDLGVSA